MGVITLLFWIEFNFLADVWYSLFCGKPLFLKSILLIKDLVSCALFDSGVESLISLLFDESKLICELFESDVLFSPFFFSLPFFI